MRLVTFVSADDEATDGGISRVGALLDGGILDLTRTALYWTSDGDSPAPAARDRDLMLLIEAADERVDELAELLSGETSAGALIPLESVRVRAPILRPGKIVGIGLNYRDHCREQGIDPPQRPTLFAMFANAVSDPDAPVAKPRLTEKLDMECELGVVIGRRASRVTQDAAPDHVFGYTIVNDVTMRDLQRSDGQWLRAKGSDGFAPMGPVVVTADELPDPGNLSMRSSVNGETWQDSSTAEMVFDVPTLISFVSQSVTLEPGDVIATGTPAGVGHYQRPPRYLQPGDVMRCEIDGIGVLENPVVQGPATTSV